MTKIVINCKVGGFNLSNESILFYAHLKGLNIGLYENMKNTNFKLHKKEIGKFLFD